jgi:hypothetical protein
MLMYRKTKIVITAMLLATVVTASAQTATTPADYMTLAVDAGKSTGTLKPLRGVNGPPVMADRGGPAPAFMRRPLDISDAYRQAAVTIVRTHDAFGAGDIDSNAGSLPAIRAPGGPPILPIDTIFPDPTADPNDPRSYTFAKSDQLIQGIRAIGADVLFRIGRTGGTTAPAPDPAKYAAITHHVVLHYNKGWDHGFTNTVKYWELWNEPDFGPLWWRGTPEQYFALYAAVSKAVKTADPQALIGGPAIAADNNVEPYREGFLDYVKANRLPLDFFSWHHYADAHDPMEFNVSAREIRKLLDDRGFTHTISVLDEWNSSVTRGMFRANAEQAAFVTSSRIYMQDAPIDLDGYYRPDGAFGANGKTPNKVGQALIAMGRMATTPQRLAVQGGDDKGFAIQAGRSTDGKTIQVLISNYEIPVDQRTPRTGPDKLTLPTIFTFDLLPRRAVSYAGNKGYALRIGGLKPGKTYSVERYRISDTDDWKMVEKSTTTGPEFRQTAALPAPGIEYLVLRQSN